jgi:hypothetical protein
MVAQPDLGHPLELVERDRLARAAALEPELGALIRARDAVEQGGDVARIGIGFLDRCGQQRSRERALLHMRALGQPRQTSGMFGIESDVQPMRGRLHIRQPTARIGTSRVVGVRTLTR